MNDNEIDPTVKRFFPWALFLALAALCALGAITLAHSEEDIWACYGSQRYQAMSSGWPPCNTPKSELCQRVEQYLLGHTLEEGRAKAVELGVPAWLVRRAERCLPK